VDVVKGFSKDFANKYHKKVKYLLTLQGGGGGRMIFVSINVEEGDFHEKSVFLPVLFCGFIVF
jgi:hypothetical protein